MFNKFCFLVGVFVLFSNAIYANGDADMLPAKEPVNDGALCSVAAKEAGDEYGVKFDLLQTISAVESGRWDDLQNRYVAWPWTVNVKGKGYYFASREDAVRAVKKFQAQGIESIDVGCMQINLKYHGEAFNSVDEAIDPANNVKYSAKFLRTLYSRHGQSWKKAAKRYHSANPEKGEAYTKRLENRFEKYKLAGFAAGTNLF
ncbi:MAG: transglycosylase SLT domain-containing protein [Alphaproteobacteria bacterium]|nr:transglycosylase SLT domain-containing protein [Alphaproteobacteria bacterium]MDY4690410.1 transglycosylase SLT domain-containing protein [Alphaproteobacteria bacterium]